MFDLRLQIIGAEAVPFDEGVDLIVAPALVLATPNGPMPLQLGLIHSPISKDTATELIKKLQAAIDGEEYEPPQPSDLVVAKSLAGVEDVAKMEQQIKGNK